MLNLPTLKTFCEMLLKQKRTLKSLQLIFYMTKLDLEMIYLDWIRYTNTQLKL